MKDCEVKIGMKVKITDELKNGQPTTSIVTVKKVLPYKDYKGRIIYEVEGLATDRFRREYKWIAQSLAEDMEYIDKELQNG